MIQRPNQNARELSLRKYFEIVDKPSWTGPAVLIFAGAALALLCFSLRDQQSGGDTSSVSMSLILLIVGIATAVLATLKLAYDQVEYARALAATQPKPSDNEVDVLWAEGQRKLLEHSRNVLNLIELERTFSDPLIIEVPTLTKTYGIPDEDLKWQKGSDGTLRFAVHKFVIIYLTERHLAAYTCDYNFIRDVALNESTREYHYQDVISVSTFEYSQSLTLPTGQKLSTSQIFKLAIASGESIEVRVDTETLRQMTEEDSVPAIAADKAVRTIRSMMRGKKGTTQAAAA